MHFFLLVSQLSSTSYFSSLKVLGILFDKHHIVPNNMLSLQASTSAVPICTNPSVHERVVGWLSSVPFLKLSMSRPSNSEATLLCSTFVFKAACYLQHFDPHLLVALLNLTNGP